MGITVIEGSNAVGKSTIIDRLSKEYYVIPKKSIPDWFRKYLAFARSCEPDIQKQIYLIGHEINYRESSDNNDYIFDRFAYSTIIRLNYQMHKSIVETVEEILSLDFNPQCIFYITADKSIIKNRLKTRNNFDFDEYFYEYENEVYRQLSKEYAIINIVNNDNALNQTIANIDSIVEEKKLFLKKG